MSQPRIRVPPPSILGTDGFVHVPIRIIDYVSDPNSKPTFVQKLRNKTAKSDDANPQWIAMTQDEYNTHWAKDDGGKFLPSVQEPSQGRVEWLRHQIRVNDLWRTRGQMLALGKSSIVGLYW